MAVYSKQRDLVRDLLEELHNGDINNMTVQNDIGNTILHKAATSNRIVLATKEILQKAPKLLSMHNRRGETALFHTAHYGKLEMFKFLDDEVKRIFGSEGEEEVEEGHKVFYQMGDKTTILHISIRTEHFALKLAKFLLARDTSWEATESAINQSKPKTHKYVTIIGDTSWEATESTIDQSQTRTIETAETPLFLAAKYGGIEIVKEILDIYPQEVEHIDNHRRNILHIAIKYHQIHVFDYVVKMEIPMMGLIRKIDNNGNFILHMVGIKADDFIPDDMPSPALQLQEDLLLFEAKFFLLTFRSQCANTRNTPIPL
ncbi:hypothetical protein HYC85_017656 [Camellia sinensis]|uniref:PGG domain-containing protein n=1 Tax=Camellia sinensis TaxID=4442 RepID=A0A7J7GS11_CAMSI|nr:hypothetical protein HYC85_017656 [Camellia sinensis]